MTPKRNRPAWIEKSYCLFPATVAFFWVKCPEKKTSQLCDPTWAPISEPRRIEGDTQNDTKTKPTWRRRTPPRPSSSEAKFPAPGLNALRLRAHSAGRSAATVGLGAAGGRFAAEGLCAVRRTGRFFYFLRGRGSRLGVTVSWRKPFILLGC